MKNEAEEDDKLEDEIEIDSEETDDDDNDVNDIDVDDIDVDDDDDDMSMGDDMDFDSDNQTIDLTDASDDEVLKVFKAMSSEDGITVVQDDDYVHLTDDNEDVEYLIQTESTEEEIDEDWESEKMPRDNEDEVVYDLELDEPEEDNFESPNFDDEIESEDLPMFASKDDAMSNLEEEIVYEIEADEADEMDYDDYMMESKMTSKPKVGKGATTGSASKFSYKKSKGGFKETMKKGNPTMGTGKPKFEFNEGESMDMDRPKKFKTKEEANEAARTYGFGSKSGRGLRKGITPNRNLVFKEGVEELETLRAKNEEYRKALNIFRDKLNEVAVFNSNLAYATRLFTEHSTSKQEKINILRRFDSAESLKESKALYKTIKDELGSNNPQQFMTESIDKVIEKAPKSGSAINLIESKTYENPQFMRMKDIMSKIIK
jgi:E3 ubiquitin-protein ligase HUWE1